jgi:hypothetical protein
MKLRPNTRIIVERGNAEDNVGLILTSRDNVTPAHRAEEPLLSG